jgi:hypothetical protein
MLPKRKLPMKFSIPFAALAMVLVSVVAPSNASAAALTSDQVTLVRNIAKTSPVMAKVVEAALTREDARYRAGGSGPDAFDCSGLVKWSFAQAGVKVKHGSGDIKAGESMILTLKDSFEGELTDKNIEIGVIRTADPNKEFKILSANEIKDYLREVE